jgi:hypothetical protein
MDCIPWLKRKLNKKTIKRDFIKVEPLEPLEPNVLIDDGFSIVDDSDSDNDIEIVDVEKLNHS